MHTVVWVVSDNINVQYIIGQGVCGKGNLDWKKIEFKILFKLSKLTGVGGGFWLLSKLKGVAHRRLLFYIKENFLLFS